MYPVTHDAMWADLHHEILQSPVQWSVKVIKVDSPTSPLLDWQPSAVLRTASIGKLTLLAAASDAIDAGTVDADELLDRRTSEAVADSGIWQHLRVDALPVADVARLVGLVSDNWATNTLLDRVGGVESVRTVTDQLGIRDLELYDRVRDVRTSEHPATLSRASADGCVAFWRVMSSERLGARVLTWLSDGLDTSMVAARLNLDPLAHSAPTFGATLVHKTGTDEGVRADTGVLTVGEHRVMYACIANWDAAEGEADRPLRDAAHHLMGRVGLAAYAHLASAASAGGLTRRES